VKLVRVGLGAFGTYRGRSGADQRGVGALASGPGTGDRPTLDRARILELWLVGGWQLEHLLRFVKLRLLDVSSFLSMVKCLLPDAPGGLLAIDPCLVIRKDAMLGLVSDGAAIGLIILADLLVIDA